MYNVFKNHIWVTSLGKGGFKAHLLKNIQMVITVIKLKNIVNQKYLENE